jgi:hypothetical protein
MCMRSDWPIIFWGGIAHKENVNLLTSKLAQFRMDRKYRTVLETLLAVDNELQAKEAA